MSMQMTFLSSAVLTKHTMVRLSGIYFSPSVYAVSIIQGKFIVILSKPILWQVKLERHFCRMC
jgi:hypothetical protein